MQRKQGSVLTDLQDTPLAQAVAEQLAGMRRITIAALGVLLEEWEPSELQVPTLCRNACWAESIYQ